MIRGLFLLLIASNFAFAQQWVTHQMSNGIEVDFPIEPTVIDTTSAYVLAFVDTAGARLMAIEELYSGYRYSKRITNLDELGAFYDYLVDLLVKSNRATVIGSRPDYKNDLLVRSVEYKTPNNFCATRILLTNGKVYMFHGCSTDSATLEMQRRFIVSLNVTIDHLLPSQFEPDTFEEDQRQTRINYEKGMAIGYILRYVSIGVVTIWLSLFVFLLVRTRSADVPRVLRIVFNMFRWIAVTLFAFAFLSLLIGFATNPAARNYQAYAFCAGVGLFGIVIAIVKPPSFRAPIV